VNVRRRNATIVAGLLLSCSLMFGAWEPLSPGIIGGVYLGVYFLPGSSQVGYACGTALDTVSHMPRGLVAKTTDGGSSWSQQDPKTSSILNAIYFKDANTGFACGMGGVVVRTTDGGANWDSSNVGQNEKLNSVSFPSNGQTGYIGAVPATAVGRVYKSTDGGATWSAKTVGPPIVSSTGCAMADDNTGVALGKNGLVWGTTDGFGTGTQQGPQTIADIVAGAWLKTDLNRGYIVGNDTTNHLGVVRYTSSGSNTVLWDSVRCPVVASFNCVDFPTEFAAYVGGANGFIGATHDPHDIWTTTTGVTTTISSICFPNGSDTGYAASGPRILKTTDAGSPWVPAVAEGKAPATMLTGIRVVSNPGRCGIALRSDAHAPVTVFDAAGRAVLTATASQGLNLLPIRKAGAYFVRSGETTVRAVVTE
jgi:photosystem II stability/assembly factor-like uncharacterized protein